MIDEIELRILSGLDSPKSRQNISDELEYLESTVSRALSGLEKLDLVYKEQVGNQIISSTRIYCLISYFFSSYNRPPH